MTEAFAATTKAAIGIIGELNRQISRLETELADHFEQHPDADIYLSIPGLGDVLGARVLGEFGDDPNRYADVKSRRNYAGTSPITRASGTKRCCDDASELGEGAVAVGVEERLVGGLVVGSVVDGGRGAAPSARLPPAGGHGPAPGQALWCGRRRGGWVGGVPGAEDLGVEGGAGALLPDALDPPPHLDESGGEPAGDLNSVGHVDGSGRWRRMAARHEGGAVGDHNLHLATPSGSLVDKEPAQRLGVPALHHSQAFTGLTVDSRGAVAVPFEGWSCPPPAPCSSGGGGRSPPDPTRAPTRAHYVMPRQSATAADRPD